MSPFNTMIPGLKYGQNVNRVGYLRTHHYCVSGHGNITETSHSCLPQGDPGVGLPGPPGPPGLPGRPSKSMFLVSY